MSDDPRRGREDRPPAEDLPTAAERLLRTLRDRGVEYVFANFGTDHTPVLEAAAHVRDIGEGESIPRFVVCPHEFAAMSAAHGYAAATGEPQAVLVHVDVGTQNLGAAMHNAHRSRVPVFLVAGLAPVTHAGRPGSRDIFVHYSQDVFDQPGIVREYCRWESEYRPPADPAEFVDRGMERAVAGGGPVYLSATREALEVEVPPSGEAVTDPPGRARRSGADANRVESIAEAVRDATAPLVITSHLGAQPGAEAGVAALVRFAETAGACVVEHAPTALNVPRDHDLHAGFDPSSVFEHADLVVLAATDVPWIPARGEPPTDAPVLQVDVDPTKPTYPQWPFSVDEAIEADPAPTLSAVAERLDAPSGQPGRKRWRSVVAARRTEAEKRLRADGDDGRLTPAVLSAAVDEIVDDSTVVVDGAVTSSPAIRTYVRLSRPGSYFSKSGAGLGWAPGAAIGVKLARPDKRVVALVGDGSYLFSHPTACAWLGSAYDAPTLTVIYDNQGWNAVERATRTAHPEGASVTAGVPESRFEAPMDLTAPATAVDSFVRSVSRPDQLDEALEAGVDAVDSGRPAVVSVQVERA